jgi:hypothetical protein
VILFAGSIPLMFLVSGHSATDKHSPSFISPERQTPSKEPREARIPMLLVKSPGSMVPPLKATKVPGSPFFSQGFRRNSGNEYNLHAVLMPGRPWTRKADLPAPFYTLNASMHKENFFIDRSLENGIANLPNSRKPETRLRANSPFRSFSLALWRTL